jgi:hypothetical protein
MNDASKVNPTISSAALMFTSVNPAPRKSKTTVSLPLANMIWWKKSVNWAGPKSK